MPEYLPVVGALAFFVGALVYSVVLLARRLAVLKARFEAHMEVHVQLLGTHGAIIERICKRVDEHSQKLEDVAPTVN